MPIPLPPEGTPLLVWLALNPGIARDLVETVNKLTALQARLVSNVGPKTGGWGLVESDTNIIFPLYLQFSATINDVDTTVGAAVATTGATNAAPYGFTTATQPDDLVARVNQLRVDVLALESTLNTLLAQLRQNGQNPTA